MSHPNILDCGDAALIVVDLQDKLLKAIHEADHVVGNSVRLIEAAKVLGIPILVTLQYAEKWGDCTQAVAEAVGHDVRTNKMSFSCMGGECFPDALNETLRRQAIICGIETHVCVNQTAHDLLGKGYAVHIIEDAVSSRTVENKRAGINKMRASGCVISTTEMAIFELLGDASREEFKRLLPFLK
jgi:nicotinamidase-related amidase